MQKRVVIILLLLAAFLIASFFYKRYHVPPSIEIPSITATDLSGQPVSLSAYAGKPLLISFFATWCGPCIRELPELAALHDQLSGHHLTIICISDAPISQLRAIDAHYGGALIILHTPSLHDAGIYTYPTNYIFAASGRKVYSQVNAENWASPAVTEKVRSLIGQP